MNFTPEKEFFKPLSGVKITLKKITPLQGVELTPLEELQNYNSLKVSMQTEIATVGQVLGDLRGRENYTL